MKNNKLLKIAVILSLPLIILAGTLIYIAGKVKVADAQKLCECPSLKTISGESTEELCECPADTKPQNLASPQDFVIWKARKDIKPFYIKKIWDDNKASSCMECHSGQKLSQLRGKKNKKAHWHIAQAHGVAQQMNCVSCHDEKEVWKFNVNKTKFSANMSVNLCAQCHFDQQKEWEMGAHGKRISGWQEQRAVMHCAECHNPHQPAMSKKWPSIAPRRPLHQ